jgi:hemerythrin superfamily protein
LGLFGTKNRVLIDLSPGAQLAIREKGRPLGGPEMTIFEVIKDDHDRMRALLKRLINNAESAPEKRTDIIARIRDEIVPHARAEEAVLYNNMRRADAPTNKVYHGFKEHAESEAILIALEAMDTLNVEWTAVAQKLHDALDHHMSEEERDLFPQAKAAFTNEQVTAMATDFKTMKPKFREQNAFTNSLELVGNLLPTEITDRLRSTGEAQELVEKSK